MKAIFACAAGLLFAAAVSAQQYKWVDQDGKVRYGDLPPPGVKATPLRGPSGPAPAATPSSPAQKGAKDTLSPEAAFQKRQHDAEKERLGEARSRQEAELKKQQCAAAQANLRMFESGDRISQIDSKGERYYLDEAQIAKGAAQARQQVASICG